MIDCGVERRANEMLAVPVCRTPDNRLSRCSAEQSRPFPTNRPERPNFTEGVGPLAPPNAQACLPLFPVHDAFERRTLRGFEVSANGVANGHKADLHDVGRNTKELCRLVTAAQMEGGES